MLLISWLCTWCKNFYWQLQGGCWLDDPLVPSRPPCCCHSAVYSIILFFCFAFVIMSTCMFVSVHCFVIAWCSHCEWRQRINKIWIWIWNTWSYLRGSERTCRSKRQYKTLSACPSPDGSRTRKWQSGVITSFAICSKERIGWKRPASFRWTNNPFTEPWVYRWNAKENCHFVVFPTSQSRYLQPLDNNVFLSLKKHWNRLAEEMSHNRLWCILFARFRLRLIQP